jgi:hypothetical protein
MALILIFFSLRLRRTHNQISEEQKSVASKADGLRDELEAVKVSTYDKLAVLKKVYLLRMKRLTKENEFWRSFLTSIMNETLREGVNPKKILGMLFGKSGLFTEEDIHDLDEAELARLIRSRDTPNKRKKAYPG